MNEETQRRLNRICERIKALADECADELRVTATAIQTRARAIEREEKAKSANWSEERWANERWSEAILAAGFAEKTNRRTVQLADAIGTETLGPANAESLRRVAEFASEIMSGLDAVRQANKEVRALEQRQKIEVEK